MRTVRKTLKNISLQLEKVNKQIKNILKEYIKRYIQKKPR